MTGPVDHQFVFSGSSLQQTTWFGQTTYGTYLTNIQAPLRLSSPGDAVSSSPTPFIAGFTLTGRVIYAGETYVSQDKE